MMEPTMRSSLAIAALALWTATALAQTAPAERQDPQALHWERWDRLSDRTTGYDVREWNPRRDRDLDRYGRYRGPAITFGAPGYFVRTLPEVTRVVRHGGLHCRVTVTRRVNHRGEIVETERRRCPGRPDMIVQRR
jgi:hypothetical protein